MTPICFAALIAATSLVGAPGNKWNLRLDWVTFPSTGVVTEPKIKTKVTSATVDKDGRLCLTHQGPSLVSIAGKLAQNPNGWLLHIKYERHRPELGITTQVNTRPGVPELIGGSRGAALFVTLEPRSGDASEKLIRIAIAKQLEQQRQSELRDAEEREALETELRNLAQRLRDRGSPHIARRLDQLIESNFGR